MKVLVTGANGQLGRDCLAILGQRHEVAGCDLPHVNITESGDVRRILDQEEPDAIVNCAAFTRVDDCETQRDAAWRANALGPGVLAGACGNALLVHISTDYVFDGERPPPTPYTEPDATNPQSWYGATKLEGEQRVMSSARRWMILRTAWLYGFHGRNFPKTMLRLARREPDKPRRVVSDQFGCPTWSETLARQIETLVGAGRTGLFHAVAEGHTTWYDFARCFLDALGVAHRIEPCRMADYPLPARRPRNSILANARLHATDIARMADWRQDVERFAYRHRDALLSEADAKP